MQSWTYEKAGVPHLKGDPNYKKEITQLIRSTSTPGVFGDAYGFGALFDFKKAGVKDPLLVASTDGVGTKLDIARLQGRHETVGIDLVAMCVNDLITCGGKPIFFLDYFATGKRSPEVEKEVLRGIADGCREAGCALIGGETAYMPGFYPTISGFHAYDIAGFSVGVVDRKKVISGKSIKKGDLLLALASSGVHSNGFSLVRKVFTEEQLKGLIGKELLKPTKIYVKPVLAVLKKVRVEGIVNVTGGGLIDNLPRIIPKGLGALIDSSSWSQPKIFRSIQDSGNISDFEMQRTFNLGVGMVLILRKSEMKEAQRILKQFKIQSWAIGEVIASQHSEVTFK